MRRLPAQMPRLLHLEIEHVAEQLRELLESAPPEREKQVPQRRSDEHVRRIRLAGLEHLAEILEGHAEGLRAVRCGGVAREAEVGAPEVRVHLLTLPRDRL